MVKDFGDVLTMPWGGSISSSSRWESLGKEIGLGDFHCSRLKMKLGVAFPTISSEVDGVDEAQQLAGVVLRPWVASSFFSLLLFPIFFLSSSPSFLSLLSLFSVLLDW